MRLSESTSCFMRPPPISRLQMNIVPRWNALSASAKGMLSFSPKSGERFLNALFHNCNFPVGVSARAWCINIFRITRQMPHLSSAGNRQNVLWLRRDIPFGHHPFRGHTHHKKESQGHNGLTSPHSW